MHSYPEQCLTPLETRAEYIWTPYRCKACIWRRWTLVDHPWPVGTRQWATTGAAHTAADMGWDIFVFRNCVGSSVLQHSTRVVLLEHSGNRRARGWSETLFWGLENLHCMLILRRSVSRWIYGIHVICDYDFWFGNYQVEIKRWNDIRTWVSNFALSSIYQSWHCEISVYVFSVFSNFSNFYFLDKASFETQVFKYCPIPEASACLLTAIGKVARKVYLQTFLSNRCC